MNPSTHRSPIPTFHRIRGISWGQFQGLLLAIALGSGFLGLIFWQTGALVQLGAQQYSILLTALIVLNFAPAIIELISKRFDPFDAKHLFLVYFFLVFVLPGICKVWLDYDPTPAFAVNEPSDSLRIRALSAILLCLAAYIAGCYLPIGTWVGRVLPCLPTVSRHRAQCIAFAGIAIGFTTFVLFMRVNGGLESFLANRESWRTLGVLSGVGYFTFPMAIVLPVSSLLLVLASISDSRHRRHWGTRVAMGIAIASLIPALILGFRGDLVYALLAFLAAWHYAYRRFSLVKVAALAAGFAIAITVYGVLREINEETPASSENARRALLFRIAGLDTVERVIWRLDQGEPYRGYLPVLLESTTVTVPRALWSNKPVSSGLIFDDIFLFDYFIARGDPIDGLKSGLSATLIGESLWIGGLPFAGGCLFALGVLARILVVWRQRGHLLHIFIYAIFMAKYALFVEVLQNVLNFYALLSIMALGMVLALTIRQGRGKGLTTRAGGRAFEAT